MPKCSENIYIGNNKEQLCTVTAPLTGKLSSNPFNNVDSNFFHLTPKLSSLPNSAIKLGYGFNYNTLKKVVSSTAIDAGETINSKSGCTTSELKALIIRGRYIESDLKQFKSSLDTDFSGSLLGGLGFEIGNETISTLKTNQILYTYVHKCSTAVSEYSDESKIQLTSTGKDYFQNKEYSTPADFLIEFGTFFINKLYYEKYIAVSFIVSECFFTQDDKNNYLPKFGIDALDLSLGYISSSIKKEYQSTIKLQISSYKFFDNSSAQTLDDITNIVKEYEKLLGDEDDLGVISKLNLKSYYGVMEEAEREALSKYYNDIWVNILNNTNSGDYIDIGALVSPGFSVIKTSSGFKITLHDKLNTELDYRIHIGDNIIDIPVRCLPSNEAVDGVCTLIVEENILDTIIPDASSCFTTILPSVMVACYVILDL